MTDGVSEGEHMERRKVALSKVVELGEVNTVGDLVELPKSTLLTPGTFNGVTFLAEEINAAVVPDVMPLTLNHSRNVEDEVGFFRDVVKENGTLKAVPIINLETTKGTAALGYVKNRMKAGLNANLSVELWTTIKDGENGERIATEIEIIKASLVDIGACSPADGCGVGLKKAEAVELGIVPEHPWKYGKDEKGAWKAPTLGDFTEKAWDELTDDEKRSIAGHFAWAPENPPERFTDLKLPHHKPGSHAVVWNGVRAAMAALAGARGGVDIPAADAKKVYDHLAAHYKEFEKEPPEFSEDEHGNWEIKGMEEIDEPEAIEPPKEPAQEPEPAQEAADIKAEVINEDAPEMDEVEEENPQRVNMEVQPCNAAEMEILKAQLDEAKKTIQELKAQLNAYQEKERGELIAELKKYAPGFDFEDKSIQELKELVEFAHAIGGAPTKRKTGVEVQNKKADPKKEFEETLKAHLEKLKKEV